MRSSPSLTTRSRTRFLSWSLLIVVWQAATTPAFCAVPLRSGRKNAAEQQLIEEVLLPINLASFRPEGAVFNYGAITETDQDDADIQGSFEYEPGEVEVLDQLLPEYMAGYLFYVLIDSAAAEQAARRNAMKNATDNANDMIETLNRVYNRVRQGAITTELNEIVGGAEALED